MVGHTVLALIIQTVKNNCFNCCSALIRMYQKFVFISVQVNKNGFANDRNRLLCNGIKASEDSESSLAR